MNRILQTVQAEHEETIRQQIARARVRPQPVERFLGAEHTIECQSRPEFDPNDLRAQLSEAFSTLNSDNVDTTSTSINNYDDLKHRCKLPVSIRDGTLHVFDQDTAGSAKMRAWNEFKESRTLRLERDSAQKGLEESKEDKASAEQERKENVEEEKVLSNHEAWMFVSWCSHSTFVSTFYRLSLQICTACFWLKSTSSPPALFLCLWNLPCWIFSYLFSFCVEHMAQHKQCIDRYFQLQGADLEHMQPTIFKPLTRSLNSFWSHVCSHHGATNSMIVNDAFDSSPLEVPRSLSSLMCLRLASSLLRFSHAVSVRSDPSSKPIHDRRVDS